MSGTPTTINIGTNSTLKLHSSPKYLSNGFSSFGVQGLSSNVSAATETFGNFNMPRHMQNLSTSERNHTGHDQLLARQNEVGADDYTFCSMNKYPLIGYDSPSLQPCDPGDSNYIQPSSDRVM